VGGLLLAGPAGAWAQAADSRALQVTEDLSASAQGGGSSEEGALFLLLPFGAQGVGVARAMTAMPGHEGVFWNPAGLGDLDRSRIVLYRGDHVAGEATAVSGLWARQGRGTVGLAYGLLDSGTQDLTDDTGTVLGSISVRGHQAVGSVATEFSGRLRAGANLKFVQFRQSCRGQCADAGVRATTYAMDLGVQLRPFEARPVQIGVMVAHLGRRLEVDGVDQSDPLPTRIRVGVSYALTTEVADEELQFKLRTEIEEQARSLGNPALLVGGQLSAGTDDRVYVRGGYIFGSRTQTDGAAVGLGLRYERFEFGISRSLARGGPALEQEPVHLTLGFALGPEPETP
jgi:hypothetical protein